MKRLTSYKCNLSLYAAPFFVAGFSYCAASFATQVCYASGDFDVNAVLRLVELSRLFIFCLLVFAGFLLCYVLVPPYQKETISYAYCCTVYDYCPGKDYPILYFKSEIPAGVIVCDEVETTPPERDSQDKVTLPVYGIYANLVAVSCEYAQDTLLTCTQTAPDRWLFKRYVQATALTTVSKTVSIVLQTCMWFALSNLFYVITVLDLTLNTAINRTSCVLLSVFVTVLPILCRKIKTVYNRDVYLRNRARRQ